MEGQLWLTIVFGLSLFVTSLHAKQVGDIKFVCPPGWVFLDTNCYLMVSKEVEWMEADRICKRYLSMPLMVDDEVENEELAKMAESSSWDSFWVGHKIEDKCKGYWDNYQPPSSVSMESCAAIQKNGRWKVVPCQSRLPFFCKKPACIEGTFDCGNGKCLNNKWLCDSVDDCGNNLDESDCDASCSFRETGASGSINYFSTYAANSDCTWSIITPPGTQIAVTFSTIRLENNVDFLEVWVGGQVLSDARLDERLTGSHDNKMVYSINNMMVLRLLSDATINSFGFRLSWTSSDAELSTDVRQMTAGTGWLSLSSPFYPNTPPSGFRREWIVTSSDKSIVTLEIEKVDLSPDWMLMIYNGEEYDDPILMASKASDLASPSIYYSTDSKIRIIMMAQDTSRGGEGIKMRAKTGCSVEIQAASGVIESPGYSKSNYPATVMCSWVLRAPTNANRDLKLKFLDLNLETGGNDLFQVFNGVDANAAALHPEDPNNGYTGDMTGNLPITLTGGNALYVKFTSSLIQNNGKFKFEFSIDCPSIPESPNMIKSSNATAYESAVVVTCEAGYSFRQQELYLEPSVVFSCQKGGMWDKSRNPTCQIIYCGAPEAIEFGFIKNSTNAVTYNNKATYQCYEGFQMQNQPDVTCLSNGEWSTRPTCTSSVCGSPPNVFNADKKIITETDATSYGAIVEYTCNDGYEIHGTSRRRCLTNSQWSDTAPTCVKKVCPLPMIANGNLDVNDPADYLDSISLRCLDGYWATTTNTTSALLSCKADQTFQDVECVDENECTRSSSPCQPTSSQDCINTIGSYICKCKDGYRKDDSGQCVEIDECAEMTSGCDHDCTNTPAGSYTCSCKAGYLLYENGTSDIFIVRGETGLRMNDVYHVKHSCVRKTCPRPAELENGKIHSMRNSFQFEDEIMYSCNLGFSLSNTSPRVCQANGAWSGPDPVCTAIKCPAQTRMGTAVQQGMVKGIYPLTQVGFGEQVIIECNREESTPFNKTRFCAYDRTTETYTLQGDAPECPVVDCGPVADIAGLNRPSLSSTVYGRSFTFSCQSGAIRKGKSTSNNNNVECLVTGRWGYGNLTCTATKCPDPGTRGGTRQRYESYEQGKIVSYECIRPGFTITPQANITCVYSSSSGTASWNGSPPTCLDSTPPQFQNCDGVQDVSIDKMQIPGFSVPTAQDNAGFVSTLTVIPPGFNPSDPVYQDTEATYTATDGNGNTMQCLYKITVKDRSPGTLICPSNIEYEATSTPTTYNITDKLIYSGGQLTSFPQVTASLDKVGQETDYRVTLRTDLGTDKTCAFKVKIVAGGCYKQLVPSLLNGNIYTEDTISGLLVHVNCSLGYAMPSGQTQKTYICSGKNNWSPALPLDDCIQYTPTDYAYSVSLTLTSGTLVTDDNCRTNFGVLYNNALSSSSSLINQQCNRGIQTNTFYKFIATDAQMNDPILFTRHKVTVTLKVENNDGQADALNACRDKLNADKATLFAFNSGGCDFEVDVGQSAGIASGQAGESCPSGYTLTSVGSNKQCFPCPPGKLRKSDGSCEDCPDGQYQQMAGQASCISCGSDTSSVTPRTSSASCIKKCTGGFFSNTGNPPCQPCPVNKYWGNYTTCTPCPDLGSTLHVTGATSVSQCRAACPMGQYSQTGYVPCTPCPRHFYQDQRAQTQCKECLETHVTDQTGSQASSDCKVGSTTTEVCSVACSDPGTQSCTYIYHRLTCTCKPGYTGDRCESEINYCLSSPCFNEGQCKPKLGGYDCECPKVQQCDMVETTIKYQPYIQFIQIQTSTIEASCKQQCINYAACEAAAFNTDDGACSLHNAEQDGQKIVDSASEYKYFIKNCQDTFFYTGTNCEEDRVDDCENHNCHENSVCRDLVNTYECVCPSGGQYINNRCEPKSNLCSPNPCRNNGLCSSSDGVRYHCICLPGYTGVDCETQINECDMNPMGCLYGGQCVDAVNSYSCSCAPGFSGPTGNCETHRNFCTSGVCSNGLCINNYVNLTSDCVCEHPFERNSNGQCSRINFCASSPCRNSTYTQRCDNLIDGYRCVCRAGYEGFLCQHNIDDCVDKPCEHGTCVDGVGSFSCECDPGWTGGTCNVDVTDCLGQCPIASSVRCVDLNQDYQCICRPGYTGKNCTDDINECDSAPCQHGGSCTNAQADYICECPPGWEGKSCENMVNICVRDGINCQNDGSCYSVFTDAYCSCKTGTQGLLCEESPNVCSLLPPCTSQGSCQQIGGDATCNCNDLYSGVSCELIKDHCEAEDCMNGGVCTLTDPSGYKCDCPAGYSGSKCENKEIVCGIGKCPSSTLCYSEGRTAYCLCPPTQVLTGSSCKDASADFDLFMDMSDESEAVKSSTPFYLAGDMTVMFWIGYFSSGRSVVISNIEGTKKYFELYPTNVTLSVNDESEDVKMLTATLKTVADQWDHVAVSWASTGDYKIYINGIQVSAGSLDFNLTVSPSLKMVSFDPQFRGYISRLTVWRKVLSPNDIATAVQNVNFNPSGDLALGWTLYKLTGRSRRYAPSHAGLSEKLCGANRPQVETCTGLPNKMKPTVSSCPSDDVTYSTDDRTVEAVTVFSTPSAAGGATVFTTLKDALLMKGRYDVVYASKDADGNYGICRFKVYVRGSLPCTVSGFPDSTACGSDAITSFCPSGQAPSVPTPNILRCGKRGSYNLMKPRELFVPPVCGAVSTQQFSVKLTLTYVVSVTCSAFTIESIKPEVKGKFLNNISNRWIGLCTGACTNMAVEAMCDTTKVIVTVTFINLAETLRKSDNSVTLRPDEILKITAKESADLELSGIGVLQKDIVIVILSPSCNEAVGMGNCVACGPGSFFNSTMGVCVYCPIGSYTDAFSQTSCKSCGDKTTLRMGSKSLSDCVEMCSPGQEFKGGSCKPCPRDHFQELEGKSFCYPCPLNKRTKVPGTDKESLCFDDCASGTELQDDGSCKDCPQGFYRTQSLHDNCQPCSDGNTTEENRTISSTGCVLPPCQIGQYINDDRVCLPCPRGKYQPVKWQRKCLMCADSYTTENEGEFNETKCKFYCPKGKEESSLNSKICEDCPAGKYRDDSLEQRFLPCQDCTPGFTTASPGATNITTDCTIRICHPGTYRNVTDNKCYPCAVGSFQPDALQTECMKCKPSYTTEGEGSTNETTDCKFYCEDGEEILSAENETCTICPRGTWRSNTDVLRFLSCQPCTSDLTTDTAGSKLASDCKLKVCTAGQELTSNLGGCTDCPADYYQEDALPSSTTKCIKCGDGKGTKQSKTTNSSECLAFCAEGQQVSDSGVCEPCPQGMWNDGSDQMRFVKCQACSNPDYTTSSEGAKSDSECTLRNCDAGNRIVSTTSCEPCGYGKFQPEKAQPSCIDCSTIGPDLNTSTTIATSKDQCTVSCPPGKQGQEGSCSPCPEDTFKSQQGYDICMPCTGSLTSNDNKDACTVTYCDKGVGYTDALTCVDCVTGYYKETRGNTACIACSKNVTTSGPKTTTADGCNELNCEPGFFAYNTDICTPCPVGFYKSTVGTANCTECLDGKTTETEGAIIDTNCTLVVCPVGQYRTSGNACEKCALGQYQPNKGAMKCEECDSGYTTLTTGKALATDCLIVCSAGKYRSARDSCSDCEVGQYQPNAGSDRCINCTSGFTTQNKASTSETDCYRTCPAGQFRPASDRTACNQCPRGQYQPDAGETDCESCDINFSTLQSSSTSANHCMPLCSSGKYLNVTSRSCIECPLGTYQPLSGTLVQECTKCREGTTTANTGSTVSANCDLADCNPGYYRKVGEGCTACGQGYYQPEKAQTMCMKCNDGYTTRLDVTTAVSANACILDCDDGYEYNLVTKQCTTCPLGKIRDKTVLDHCYNCPDGKSTTTRGALTCIDAPASPTLLLVRKRVKIRMSFRVAVCENPGIVEHTIRISIRFLIRRQSSRYPRLCVGNCINVKISFTQTCGTARRRKRANIPVQAEITAADLPEQIANTDDTLTRSGESLLTEALANNDDVANNLTQAGITYEAITAPDVTTECVSGSRKIGDVCEACPIGTKHNMTTDQCESCPKDKYQDQTGQTTCKSCSGKLKTLGTKSNSSAACLSKCKLEPNYCKNKGTCEDVDSSTVKCNCPESYTGETCAIRQSVESDLQYIIIGVCAGIFVILVVILVIGCCCCRKDPSDKTNKDMHSIVAPSAGYTDYMQSPFMTRDYLAPQGYVQYPNPEFNDAYDFYKSGRRYSDH